MASGVTVFFPHRCNSNGTWDSICPRCYLTIANSENEAELYRAEQTHDCDEYAAERNLNWHAASE